MAARLGGIGWIGVARGGGERDHEPVRVDLPCAGFLLGQGRRLVVTHVVALCTAGFRSSQIREDVTGACGRSDSARAA